MRLWYRILLTPARLLSVVLFRLVPYGRQNLPKKGGFILASNHQSYLDLFFITICLDFEVSYVAREDLWKSSFFRFITSFFHRIKIKRDEADASAIKKCVDVLKSGRPILMFPEGTRTRDGKLSRFKPGYTLIAKMAEVPVIPVVITGSYGVLPKNAFFPRLCRVKVSFSKSQHDSDNRQRLESLVYSEIEKAFYRQIRTWSPTGKRRSRK